MINKSEDHAGTQAGDERPEQLLLQRSQAHGNCTGPTFDEARRDFNEMARRHIYN